VPIELDGLREQLRNYRTRAAAIDEAVAAGQEAVEPAIQLLHDRSEAVRWSAIRILSEIGDTRAIGPLVGLLERRDSSADAAAALRALTGQDFGEDASAWRQWAASEGGVDLPPERGRMTDRDLVEAALAGHQADLLSEREGRFVARVSLPGGRSQRVYLDFRGKDPDGEPLVRVYTRCGKATPERYAWALKQNLRMAYGSIAVAPIDGVDNFVVFNTHLRATVDPEDLSKSLVAIARQGDEVERLLSDADTH